MSNPFLEVDPWDVSLDNYLPAGNHVCEIVEAEDGTSSGNYPQIELKLKDSKGDVARDWMVITPRSAGKVVALANAAGVAAPSTDDIVDMQSLRLSGAYLDRFIGKTVGVVIRDEPDRTDPTKNRARVQGYVEPQKITNRSDMTSNAAGGSFGSAKADVEIPF